MRKKNVVWFGSLTAAVLGLTGLALAVLAKHEPTFYSRSERAACKERKTDCETFLRNFVQMMSDVRNSDGHAGEWAYQFTESEIDSFLEEDFIRLGEAENLKRLGLSSPRVALEKDRIRLGFRYGTGLFSAIVSYDMKVWLVSKEPNLLAVQILGRRVGALPIATQGLLGEISELARRHNIEVQFFRHEGAPVALVRFQADRPRPTTQFTLLQIDEGKLKLGGGSK